MSVVIKKNLKFMLLSLCFSVCFCFLSVPYYTLRTVILPGEMGSIFLDYADKQKLMIILFTSTSIVSTILLWKKKKSFEDIVLNLLTPLSILLLVRILRHAILSCVVVILFSIGLTIMGVFKFKREKTELNKKRLRRYQFYIARRIMVYSLFIGFLPLVLWANYQDDEEKERILFSSEIEVAQDVKTDDYEMEFITEHEWEQLDAEGRFAFLKELTRYECSRLGVNYLETEILGIYEHVDGPVAYYKEDGDQKSFSYNMIAIMQQNLEKAIFMVCHEVHHQYQYELIRTIDLLQESGSEFETLLFYSELIQMRDAKRHYYFDSFEQESYENNYLEVCSNQFASEELDRLKSIGCLE